MPNETPYDTELIEQLTLRVEHLTGENAQLTGDNEQLQAQLGELQEALARAESHNTQLTSIIDATAEDLQLFGSAWLKPSGVRSITFQLQGGIHIDGIPVELLEKPPTEQIASQMKSFAERINALNAQRRNRAKKKSSQSVPTST